MKKLIYLLVAVSLMLALVPAVASAEDVVTTVPGTACVYFAGQTQSDLEAAYPPSAGWINVSWDVGGAGNHGNFHNDTANWEGVWRAQQQSRYFTDRTGKPVVPPYVEVCGDTLSISATGEWGHGPAHPSGPGGKGVYNLSHAEYDDLGISLVGTDLNTLVGVFLTDDPPDSGATPGSLSGAAAFTTTPELQQAFAIGASQSNITIPAGATRLFLGLHNGYEWWNNGGSVEVTVSLDCVVPVDIDIKPGSDPNCFNINGNGVVPVAILGSADFVTQIDVSTLSFGGLDVRVKGNGTPQCSVEDVSGDFTSPEGAPDGHADLVCQFVDDSTWSADDGTATLSGNLTDGTPFEGSDEICLRPE